MIKKLISFALLLQFVFLNTGTVFAKSFYTKPDYIEITKEQPGELKSFLAENYTAYKYSIKNNGKETCKLTVCIDSIKELYKQSAKDFRKDMFHRTVPRAIMGPVALTIEAGFLAFLFVIFPPVGYIAFGTSDFYEPKKLATEMLGREIIDPAKSTVMLPYDTVNNIKETKKAKKEIKKYEKYLIDRNTPIKIKPGKTFEFYAFANNETNKIYLITTVDKDTYKFSY